MNEIWKMIPGWEGYYDVSDRGSVRSVDRVVSGRRLKGRILRSGASKSGYKVVALSRPGQKPTCFNVHTLVLTAFVGPAPEGMECCHGPEGAGVNSLDNLRWDTRSSNAMDRHRDGTFDPDRGEDNANAKLSDEEVRHIRRLRGHMTQRDMAAYFGVSHSVVGKIQRRQAWSHVA